MFSLLAVKKKTSSFCVLRGAEAPVILWYTKWLCASIKVAHFLAKGIQLWFVGLSFTALPVHSCLKAPQIVEVVGTVNLAAEHHQAGGGFPAARHEGGAARWGANGSLAGCESPKLPSCRWHALPLGTHTEMSMGTESCRCYLSSQP